MIAANRQTPENWDQLTAHTDHAIRTTTLPWQLAVLNVLQNGSSVSQFTSSTMPTIMGKSFLVTICFGACATRSGVTRESVS